MRITRDIMLLVSFLIWGIVMALIYFDEQSRINTSRIPTLTSMVFSEDVELLAQKGLFFQFPGSSGDPLRVGTWNRRIRYGRQGDSAQVDTRVEFKVPDAVVSIMRDNLGDFMAADLIKTPRATLHAATNVERDRGLTVSVSQINVFGKEYTERRRVIDGKVRVEHTEGKVTTSRNEDHEWSDAEVGFGAVSDIDLNKTWDVLILDLITRKPQVIRVRVTGTLDYVDEGRRVRAFEVEAESPSFSGLRAVYDGRGRVLLEQGVFWPFVQLTFKREKSVAKIPETSAP